MAVIQSQLQQRQLSRKKMVYSTQRINILFKEILRNVCISRPPLQSGMERLQRRKIHRHYRELKRAWGAIPTPSNI